MVACQAVNRGFLAGVGPGRGTLKGVVRSTEYCVRSREEMAQGLLHRLVPRYIDTRVGSELECSPKSVQ